MKIVVIGGTGLIGSKVVTDLTEHGHEAVPASPRLGINTITGEGLAAALEGASAVVDVSNSANFEYLTALEFFATSTHQPGGRRNGRRRRPPHRPLGRRHAGAVGGRRPGEDHRRVLPREARRGGPDPDVRDPYSIVHATQFFEFIKGIADVATVGDAVRLPPVRFQPMAAADVAGGCRPDRGRGAGQRHRRGRRAGNVCVRRGGPAGPRGDARHTARHRRPRCNLLRHRCRRAVACPRGRGVGRPYPSRGLAPTVPCRSRYPGLAALPIIGRDRAPPDQRERRQAMDTTQGVDETEGSG